MDATAVGITAAASVAFAYCGVLAWRQRRVDLGGAITVAAAVYSVPGTIQLFMATIEGQVAELPVNWRQDASIAAVIQIVVIAHLGINYFRRAWKHVGGAAEPKDEP